MIESTRLPVRRLISTRRESRPKKGAVSPSTPASAAPAPDPPRPTFRSEGTWDGREAPEHAVDNSAPSKPKPDSAAPVKTPLAEPAPRRRRQWAHRLGVLASIAAALMLLTLLGEHHHRHLQPPLSGPKPGSSGVGMPTTLPGDTPVKPLRIAVVLGVGLTRRAQAEEIRTLETWLSGHINPVTRLTVVDAPEGLTTPALTPSAGPLAPPDHRFRGTPANVLRRQLGRGRGRPMIVSFDHADPMPGGEAAHLHLLAQPGAGLPSTVPLRPGGELVTAIDPNEDHAFANTVAKAVISISDMAEGEEE